MLNWRRALRQLQCLLGYLLLRGSTVEAALQEAGATSRINRTIVFACDVFPCHAHRTLYLEFADLQAAGAAIHIVYLRRGTIWALGGRNIGLVRRAILATNPSGAGAASDPAGLARCAGALLAIEDAEFLYETSAAGVRTAQTLGFTPAPHCGGVFSKAVVGVRTERKSVPEPSGAGPTHRQVSQQDVSRPVTANRLPTIVFGTEDWGLTGVNVFTENMCRELLARGYDARILLTESDTIRVDRQDAAVARPADLPFMYLDVGRLEGWGAHWGEMVAQLERLAPCIYIPNSDWRHSCAGPLLSGRVGVVGPACRIGLAGEAVSRRPPRLRSHSKP